MRFPGLIAAVLMVSGCSSGLFDVHDTSVTPRCMIDALQHGPADESDARDFKLDKCLASNGSRTHQLKIARIYEHGSETVERDERLARYWYRRAADDGPFVRTVKTVDRGLTGRRKREKYEFQFRGQSKPGLPEAQFRLGLMILDGRGTAADPEEALRWIRKSADRDYEPARAWLADNT